jgi:hypothetical protein
MIKIVQKMLAPKGSIFYVIFLGLYGLFNLFVNKLFSLLAHQSQRVGVAHVMNMDMDERSVRTATPPPHHTYVHLHYES